MPLFPLWPWALTGRATEFSSTLDNFFVRSFICQETYFDGGISWRAKICTSIAVGCINNVTIFWRLLVLQDGKLHKTVASILLSICLALHKTSDFYCLVSHLMSLLPPCFLSSKIKWPFVFDFLFQLCEGCNCTAVKSRKHKTAHPKPSPHVLENQNSSHGFSHQLETVERDNIITHRNQSQFRIPVSSCNKYGQCLKSMALCKMLCFLY